MGGMGLGDGNFSVTPLIKVRLTLIKDIFFRRTSFKSKEQSKLVTVEGARVLIIALQLSLEKEARWRRVSILLFLDILWERRH